MNAILPIRLLAAGAAAGLAAAALTGCTTTEGARLPVNTTSFAYENTEKFVLMNDRAQFSVTASGLQERLREDGRLEVAANLRNRESRRIQVQWQVVFKDEQGFALEETPWRDLIMTENGQETVRAAALSPAARRYTFRVREAR